MSKNRIIELKKLSKVFYTEEMETHALSEVDLFIDKGEFVSIEGPSGCGKSTLLSIIGLLDTATSGEYSLNQNPVTQLKNTERSRIRNRQIGFIFQSFNLMGDMTVFDNVELPLIYRGVSKSERREKVMIALKKVDMVHRAKHMPSQLSGGQQQRVAVARALAGDPDILLADEPTGNLDSKNGGLVMDMLAKLNEEGSTICMVTHDDRYAHSARRIVHLFDGKIVNGGGLKR